MIEPTVPPVASPPPVRSLRHWLMVAIPLVVAGLLLGLVAAGAARAHGGGGPVSPAPPAANAPLDLGTVNDTVAAHYRYAEAHEDTYRQVPCFCGCEEFLAHGDLYDCFVRADGAGYDAHAAGCGVCIGESAIARSLIDRGAPAAVVRDQVIAQFGATPSTGPDDTLRT